MLLTGTASALTGAPGSVFMYGLLGLMAWPRPPRRWVDWSDRPVGVASSAAAQGIGRSVTPLAVWAGYWSLAAVLFLLPDNRTTRRCRAPSSAWPQACPGWYAHFLTNLGNLFSTTGTQTAWILAVVAVVIGLGPLVARRPGWFLAAGALFAFLLWIAGQGLVGNVFSGSDTDPNTGPLVILLAAAMVPTVMAVQGGMAFARRRGPAAEPGGGRPRHRRAGCGARSERQLSRRARRSRRASAMSGMVMNGGGRRARARSRPRASTCTPHQTGFKISGLDLANTPVHDHERHQRHGHERSRRQRGGRLQHDDAQLALHGPGHPAGRGAGAAGGRQQRARATSTWRRAAARRA